MQLAFLLGAAHIAFGATGLSGRWGVRAQTTSGPAVTVGCLVETSQSGTALSLTGSCDLIRAVTLTGTYEPSFIFTIKAGERLVMKRPWRRPRAVVLRCLPALAGTATP